MSHNGRRAKSKQDGFNLDVMKLSIAKPQDESPWASGYQVDLLFGPDAVGYNPSANTERLKVGCERAVRDPAGLYGAAHAGGQRD